jgi:hypothetical protein
MKLLKIVKMIIKKCNCADWYSSQEEKEQIVAQRIEEALKKVREEDAKKVHL